jgi:prevent-host-death family protein
MRTEIVTTLKRRATRILADVRETKEPVLITEHGKPSAYLVDAASFEHMRDRMTILEGIARGERAVLEGRTLTQAEARRRMKKWLA